MTDLAPRPVQTGLEEAETTRTERFLAVVLGAFLLVGLLWAYAVPLDRTEDAFGDGRPRAVVVRDDAQQRVFLAEQRFDEARVDEEAKREAYRTRLDAGQPSATEEAAYAAAQRVTAEAERERAAARAEYERVRPAGDAAEREYGEQQVARADDRSRDTFLLRLGFTLLWLGGSFFGFDRLRRRRSRAVTPAMGAVGAGALLAVVMAADYLDLESVGPIALSLFGTTVTVAVIVAYQRWLAARLPERRARKQECPACGYPTRSGVPHCEGCGRQVLGECTSCHGPRRAGVAYCGTCGAT